MKAVELGRPRGRLPQQKPPENLFGWWVFILLLCGFAVCCWIGTFYVFNHPEQPFNYQLLTKLHKLDAPKRFELTAAPNGEFVGTDKLLQRYGSLTPPQLNEASNELLRSFLRNYDHQITKIPYVTGKFTVMDAFPTTENQFFGSGLVVIAQSNEVPTVYIENIFPAPKEALPSMQRILLTGLGIELRRSYDLSAAVHIADLGNGRLLFTTVPLIYGSYGQNGASFQLEPPKSVVIRAGLPILSQNQVRDAETRLAEYQRATGTNNLVQIIPRNKSSNLAAAAPVNSPTLVAALRALPVNTPGLPGRPAVAASPVARPSEPAAPRAELVNAFPSPGNGTASQSFLAASPTPGVTSRVGVWTTYRPGQMPRGRLVTIPESLSLADNGIGSNPVYLQGAFTVTAARENRAVLRPKADEGTLNGLENARIIAEFPRGSNVPREGNAFSRQGDRPFQIVDIRRGADGQINIYVREITVP